MDEDDLRSMHARLAGFHSTVFSARFAAAALYMAASAFLVTALPEDGTPVFPSAWAIALLGLLLTVALWVLEIRNACLLENLDERGRVIEDRLKVDEYLGFFYLMKDQRVGPRFPLVPKEARWSFIPFGKKGKPIVLYIFSHSTGLSLIYLFAGIFWACVLLIRWS